MKNFLRAAAFTTAFTAALTITAIPLCAQKTTLKLAIGYIPHVQFTPLYVGTAKGFYAEENIDLKIEYGFGVDIFSLLAAGKIDLGLSDSDQLILAGAKGLPLKAVFQYYQKYPVTVLAKSERIRKPEDFAGKRIGTPELYGTSYIGLRVFLEHFGLAGKVTIERIGYTQITSLLGGRVDGAVCFFNNEPLQLKASGMSFVQWDVKDFSDLVGASIISSAEILEKKEAAVRAFNRATAKAVAYTIDHRDEAYDIAETVIGNQGGAKRLLAKEALASTCTLFAGGSGIGTLNETKYQRSVDTLYALGLIPRRYPAKTLLWPAP